MKKFILLLILTVSLYAQQGITWNNATALYPSLPEGVKLFKGERSTPALKIYYFEVNLNDTNVAVRPYITSAIATVPALCTSFGAYGAINGGFFGGTSSYSAVVYPEEVKAKNVASVTRNAVGYPVIRSMFSIKNNLSMSVDWIYHFGNNKTDIYKFNAPLPYIYNDPNPLPPPNISGGTKMSDILTGIGGAPVLVKNGQRNITYNEEIMWGSGVGYDNQDPRTGVGFTADNRIIMLVADGRLSSSLGISLIEMADIFISLGCVEAINLDGGGSSQMSVGSTPVNLTTTRQVPTILAIVHRDSLAIPQIPVFEKVIDTGDSASCDITGTHWTTSSIPGFWGSTPTIRNPKGDGSEYVTFFPGVDVSAVYTVQGWWTAASDRCKDTPFIIKHKNGIDTIRIDQSAGGGKWNNIGSFELSGNSSDEIIINNSASTGTYVVADAIRLISYDTAAIVSVKEENLNKPSEFILYQNYPNPFNPSTHISFYAPSEMKVQIIIYDILGNEIVTLFDGYVNEGRQTKIFNAKDIPSGVYFYQIKTAETIKPGKMILQK
jgi:hypothetical protein